LLGALGIAARDEGELTSAAELFERASTLHRSAGNRFNLAVVLQKLAAARLDSGLISAAAAPLRESLAIWVEAKNDLELSFILEGFAIVVAEEQPQSAVRLLAKAD